MKAAGQKYDSEVKAKRKGHGLGPPCIYTARALMQAIIEHGEKVGKKHFDIISAYIQEYDQLEVADKTQVAAMCCFRKCAKKDHIKLIFGFGMECPQETRKAMKAAVVNIEGVELSLGRTAHFGPELAAQDILEQLQK